ncbi:MAG: relaxase, partial [Prevotellaceae bacterium]|nr:relaxase [Prevotellaceae bacterium]
DHAIHIRAHRAAEQVARQKGWITARHIHESRIPQVSKDCMEALRELDKWSWEGYIERLAAKGYTLYPRKDDEGIIRGYMLHKGSSRFKGSELGKGRNLTASRIERTWEKLHPGQAKQECSTPKQPVITTPKPSVHNEAEQKPQTDAERNNSVYEYYTEWQPDRLRTEFEYAGKNYDRYIPEKVPDSLNDEFDFRELANWQVLQNLAIAFFTLVASPYGEVSGGGGGGSQSDLKWGRDPEEDEIEFMRRCAREASHRLGIQKKSGMKRK